MPKYSSMKKVIKDMQQEIFQQKLDFFFLIICVSL